MRTNKQEKKMFTERLLAVRDKLPTNYASIAVFQNNSLSKQKIYNVKNYCVVDWEILDIFEKMVQKNNQ